jgi:membrane-bound inhibitor of C-type lysozyme
VATVGRDAPWHVSTTDEIPINFKAAKNGTYTLTFDTQNLDLEYLHLIDNLTGNDVDLLTPAGFPLYKGGQGGLNQPSYTFTAKTTDYASRFRLVFSEPADETSANQTFAYIADGEIRINEADARDASLQVVDVMGRVIVTKDVARNVSTNGMTPGVYVLRLIDGDNVKTQKIVVE